VAVEPRLSLERKGLFAVELEFLGLIAGGSPSFNGSRSKVIVVRVIGVCSREVAGIGVTWCGSRRKGYCKSLLYLKNNNKRIDNK
jgi:hypothetical protein